MYSQAAKGFAIRPPQFFYRQYKWFVVFVLIHRPDVHNDPCHTAVMRRLQ